MYEKLLDEAHEKGLTVIERYPFASPRIRGLCYNDTIALSSQIETEAERTVILCEEMTHATRDCGNILCDARAERRTRERSFDRLIGKAGLVRAYLTGCRAPWEFAEWFGVPEDFFAAAMRNYRERYGTGTAVTLDGKRYILSFEPTLRVSQTDKEKDA